MKKIRDWLRYSPLVTGLFFVVACLALIFSCTGSGMLAELPFMLAETCRIEVRNQSGETLRVTPIDSSGKMPATARLYYESWPSFPAFQQRNITVNSGDSVYLYPDCNHNVSKMYACDRIGQCYVHTHRQFLYDHTGQNEVTVYMDGFTFTSLESLSPRTRPCKPRYSPLQNMIIAF